jgi:hypothetical protein
LYVPHRAVEKAVCYSAMECKSIGDILIEKCN